MEVFTKLTNQEVEESLLSGITKQWEVFSSLEGDEKFGEIYNKVKNGVKVTFDIRLVTKGFVEEFPAMKIVKVARKLVLNIYDYYDELEERQKLMKEILRMSYDDTFDNQDEKFHKEYD